MPLPLHSLCQLYYHLVRGAFECMLIIDIKLKVVNIYSEFSFIQFSSVAQLCPTLCNPVNRGMPGLPVHHQLPEFIQTHVHRVGDAIQPPHPHIRELES